MTITTKRTKHGKYLVSAEQNGNVFMSCRSDRREAFSSSVRLCYEFIKNAV